MIEIAELKPDRDEPRHITDGLQHGGEQHRHIVAIARLQLQCGGRPLQRLDIVNVLNVADILANEFKQRFDFAEPILTLQRLDQA